MFFQKDEGGSYTVEATFSLTIFLFFMMTFLAFGRYTAVQNSVKHSLNQAVITMSEVNLQRVRNDNYLNSVTGVTNEDIVSFFSLLNEDWGNKIRQSTLENIPYTSTSTYANHITKSEWTNEDLKPEILRYFTYYYLPNYEVKDGVGYDTLCEELKKRGLEILEISSVTNNAQSPYSSKTDKVTGKTTYVGPDSVITKKDRDITESSTFISNNKITVSIRYKINTGFSFHRLFGIVDAPEFQDSVTFVLMK